MLINVLRISTDGSESFVGREVPEGWFGNEPDDEGEEDSE